MLKLPNLTYEQLLARVQKTISLMQLRMLLRDIPGYLSKAEYLGWRSVIVGKHPEAAYFSYYSRELGARTILCMRKMADGGIYKPYAIISQAMFDAEVKNLQKGTPF